MKRLLPLLIAAAVLAGCGDTGAKTEEPQGAKAPSRLVFAFQKQKDPTKTEAEAKELAEYLSKEIGLPVDVVVPTSYSASVQALVSERAHVAYVSSLPFLLAKAEAPVEIVAVEEREGSSEYESLIVVSKSSPFQKLEDLKGKRMAFTSPTSMSGCIWPTAEMMRMGMLEKGQKAEDFFGQVVHAGAYDRALQAVVRGQSDACAVSDYTMEGDSADLYLTKAEREKLRVLARLPGVPTHLICQRADLPEDLKAKIAAAIEKVSKERPELFKDVYGASAFKFSSDEAHVRAAQEAVSRLGLPLKGMEL